MGKIENNPYMTMSDEEFIAMIEAAGGKVVEGTGQIIITSEDADE